MHTVFALLCFVVVIHWLIFPYPSGLLHWHCGNLTIAPVPAKQPWWIWINTSCEIIMNDYITTTKQSTTKPCAYLLGYTVALLIVCWLSTPSHYLNQCRLIISEAVWRSPEGNPTWNAKKYVSLTGYSVYSLKLWPHIPGSKLEHIRVKCVSKYLIFMKRENKFLKTSCAKCVNEMTHSVRKCHHWWELKIRRYMILNGWQIVFMRCLKLYRIMCS